MDRNYIIAHRNQLGKCPCCGSKISDRVMTIHSEMVSDLYKVYEWCSKMGRTEFHIRDVKALMSKSSYANFSKFLTMGNGTVSRPIRNGKKDRSMYCLNMENLKNFFSGHLTMTVQATINQITDTIIDRKNVYVYDFPSVMSYLKANGLYDYEKRMAVEPPRKKVLRPFPNPDGTVTMKLV